MSTIKQLSPEEKAQRIARKEELRKRRNEPQEATTPKKGMKTRTPSRTAQERVYRARVSLLLQTRYRKTFCPVVWETSKHTRKVPVTQCHHIDGREGKLLLKEDLWLFVSDEGHRWIHEHPNAAREQGWLK